MRVVHLVPGTGNFHCGACLRDDALLGGLRSHGHEVIAVPLYLPMVLEEKRVPYAPLFLGGVNLFLQEKSGLFRAAPRWMERWLDAPGLLRMAASFAGMTRAEDLGALTFSTLEAMEGRQRKEWQRLRNWLAEEGKPEVVSLSNGLLMGFAKTVAAELGVPVVANFQGEDSFIDGLPAPWKERCWEAFEKEAQVVSRFVAVSQSHGKALRGRVGAAAERVRVVPNGIAMSDYRERESSGELAIGFFSRMCPPKGLHLLVEAFLELAAKDRWRELRLKIGGAMTMEDRPYVRSLRAKIAGAGCAGRVEWFPNLGREEKRDFYRSLTLFSVPAEYEEAFGIYLLEAMEQGVPVVQPDRGAFPEIVELTGGGLIVEGGGSAGLVAALEALLLDEGQRHRLGLLGREGVRENYGVEKMVAGYEAVLREALEDS